MNNHPNRSGHRYLKVSRGFVNTVLYLRVPEDKITEAEAVFADYSDRNPGCWTAWTTDRKARMPGVAVDWDDRAHVGL